MLIAPKTWDNDKLKVFERSQQAEIRTLSVGLSDQEIYDYYGIDNITRLPEYDRLFLKVNITRGRLVAKQNATHQLFKAMEGKDALPASLAYLTRFGSDAWQSAAGTGARMPREVKIVIEE
ncbi:MAG: hypothetical protein GY696_25090 [Gammaproteobacteria bacterium]|nr:hypothetical protein [Gammaproteobacteria bacterium]